jgi:hypothetical protein
MAGKSKPPEKTTLEVQKNLLACHFNLYAVASIYLQSYGPICHGEDTSGGRRGTP